MKKSLIFLAVVALFLAACGAEATPTQAPSGGGGGAKDTPPPARQTAVAAAQLGTPLPDYTPRPTKQPITGPVARVNATCTISGKPAETRVAQGTTIILWWGWIAPTQEQVQAYIDNAIIAVTFDGAPVADPNPGRPAPTEDGKYSVVWGVNVGAPAAGSHTVTYSVSWKASVSDGVNNFGPGTGTESQSATCTVIVE